jgi:hypothetical protein
VTARAVSDPGQQHPDRVEVGARTAADSSDVCARASTSENFLGLKYCDNMHNIVIIDTIHTLQ